MKNFSKVVYNGPFHINTTQALCGSSSQIVSRALFIDNIDICMVAGKQDEETNSSLQIERFEKKRVVDTNEK